MKENYIYQKRGHKILFLWIPWILVFVGIGIKGIIEAVTERNIVSFCVICLWTSFPIFMVMYALKTATSDFCITKDGIYYKDIFRKRELNWFDISDYGIAYSSVDRDFSKLYYLYFSREELPLKGKYKKRFFGKKAIKVEVSEIEYQKILKTVLPYCRGKLGFAPFITEKKPKD